MKTAQALKGAGAVLIGVMGFMALVFLMALYIAGLAWVSETVYEYLNIAATIALAICVFVLFPSAFFRATRKFSAYGLFISSVIFGASTWILGFLVTLHYWGGIGVFFGVVMAVVGIVPLGMLASAFHSDWAAVGQLALGLFLTFGARMIAYMLAAWIDRNEAGINSNSPSGSTAPQLSRHTLVTVAVLGLVLIGSVGVWITTQRPATEEYLAALRRGDYATALRLIRPLADQGNADTQASLGFAYDIGYGVPQNDAEAIKWYRRAAVQGNVIAQYNLAVSYANGQGVPQNYAEAMKWYRRAADQGSATAQFGLGLMYYNGQGVPQNYAEAMKWYRLAADQGFSAAQINLGHMYLDGYSVPKDYVSAYMWLNLAAAQFGEIAAKSRDEVEQLMTPTQIAEAQKLAREWKPTKRLPR